MSFSRVLLRACCRFSSASGVNPACRSPDRTVTSACEPSFVWLWPVDPAPVSSCLRRASRPYRDVDANCRNRRPDLDLRGRPIWIDTT
ncbi:hypothetical protein GGS23DRAFT_234064 [Durotheca rogersii]|uniref:uncharacterized protein n=1 Tax=Durotheca rogersii TaxID=419775 RepID=UPI002220EE0C|nr:uncharacterized protein GGS23DRAFT_234064 [Durotheca rogersii]KAI5860356.1 hypothetical protein GGS23DRAFT_234064 [Durotheca rogersii]